MSRKRKPDDELDRIGDILGPIVDGGRVDPHEAEAFIRKTFGDDAWETWPGRERVGATRVPDIGGRRSE